MSLPLNMGSVREAYDVGTEEALILVVSKMNVPKESTYWAVSNRSIRQRKMFL